MTAKLPRTRLRESIRATIDRVAAPLLERGTACSTDIVDAWAADGTEWHSRKDGFANVQRWICEEVHDGRLVLCERKRGPVGGFVRHYYERKPDESAADVTSNVVGSAFGPSTQ